MTRRGACELVGAAWTPMSTYSTGQNATRCVCICRSSVGAETMEDDPNTNLKPSAFGVVLGGWTKGWTLDETCYFFCMPR